ncbi:unnamed protein product, partial [Gordionus sp. m RMFG-2023]
MLNCSACDSEYFISKNCMPIQSHLSRQKNPYVINLCDSFVRSSAANTKFGPREQLNENTAFIDASMIYGSNNCIAKYLRKNVGGRLRSQSPALNINKDSIKIATDLFETQCQTILNIDCFLTGDPRANTPMVASFYMLFINEHNRIANELSKYNPSWRDEELYQETRKIIGAMVQHITFNEFLPKLMGNENMKRYNLYLEDMKNAEYYDNYNDKCEPGIRNSFSTAAFKFFDLILSKTNSNLKESQPSSAKNGKLFQFLSQTDDSHGKLEWIIKTITSTRIDDISFGQNANILNQLLPAKGKLLDPISYHIQRGRDHGLPSYIDFIKFCNISINLKDLKKQNEELKYSNLLSLLVNLYDHIEDIDVFMGALAETPSSGAIIGPTLSCLIATQFYYIKNCDRFWYENNLSNTGFTLDQLNEIRKISLAKVICNNLDTIHYTQPQVMAPFNLRNRKVSCKTLYNIDLRKWSKSEVCYEKGFEIEKGAYHVISPCNVCYCPFTGNKARCNSVKIENCFQLFVQHPREKILEDESCLIQCSFVFQLPIGNENPAQITNANNNTSSFLDPIKIK